MRISVVSEQVFSKTPDGAYWTTGAPGSFWKRYLEVFEKLRIVARVERITTPPHGSQSFNHRNVELVDVPFYRGPSQFLTRVRSVRAALHTCFCRGDAWLLRVPSTLANLLTPVLEKQQQPYAVEVVGDPQDVFATKGISHFFRPVFRRWFSRHQQNQCQRAVAAAYVTKQQLQSRYPASLAALTTHYSSLDLPDQAYLDQARPPERFRERPLKLITVASLAQLYKAPHILIDSLAKCLHQGCDVRLEIVGDGIYRGQLQQQVSKLGIENRVQFTGQVSSGRPVWNRLDENHLFVLPSLTEGLPRAMIEAMARGMPCIGSTAGGIPELLPEEFLVQTGCQDSLSAKIAHVSGKPALLHAMSAANLSEARQYQAKILRARRNALYRHLLEIAMRRSGGLAA